jgi:hypothetical protein
VWRIVSINRLRDRFVTTPSPPLLTRYSIVITYSFVRSSNVCPIFLNVDFFLSVNPNITSNESNNLFHLFISLSPYTYLFHSFHSGINNDSYSISTS